MHSSLGKTTEKKAKINVIVYHVEKAYYMYTNCMCYFAETPTKQTANKMSPTNPDTLCDRQFIVIASEKQVGVFALPSQNCVYKKNIVETDFVVKAEIISMKGKLLASHNSQQLNKNKYLFFFLISDSVCLICYASNGHLLVFTLPSLKLLLDIDFLPLSDLR